MSLAKKPLNSKAKVQIMGKEYTLKGDVDSEYMIRLAEYVNKKTETLKNSLTDSNSSKLALLVSLNIADELFQAKQKEESFVPKEELSIIESKTEALIAMLENGLIGYT